MFANPPAHYSWNLSLAYQPNSSLTLTNSLTGYTPLVAKDQKVANVRKTTVLDVMRRLLQVCTHPCFR